MSEADKGELRVEKDCRAELDALSAGFRERKAAEEKRRWRAIDSEHWFCVCFVTREQKNAFLTAMGWTDIGDKYVDGLLVAERLGLSLPPSD